LGNLANLYLENKELDKAFSYSMLSIAFNSQEFDTFFPNLFEFKLDKSTKQEIPFCRNVSASEMLNLNKIEFISSSQINSSLAVLLAITKAQYNVLKSANNPEAQNKLLLYYNISLTAIKINKKLRKDFSSEKNKLRALKRNHEWVSRGLDAALLLNEKKFLTETFSFSEENKAVILLDALKSNQAQSFGDLPDSLSSYEKSLFAKKDAFKKEFYEKKLDKEAQEIIANKLNKLNLEIETFLASVKDKYPRYHGLKYSNITASAADIQHLLDDKTALLEYFITDTISYLFVLTKKDLTLHPIEISKDILNKQVQKLRKAVSNYSFIVKGEKAYALYTNTAFWFYKNFLEVGLVDENLQNLIIIPDGNLGQLPFEIFLTQTAPQNETPYEKLPFLINDYNISYNYSATLWKENKAVSVQKNNHKILACAASYSAVDSSLLELRQPFIFKSRSSLNPLPAAQNEVKSLETFFEGVFLQNNDANEAYFKKNAHKYSVIHLAMHGLLHPREPLLSNLAFTENRDSLEDNFLHNYEISHLNLNADLIVLSACETGYGKYEKGEGILSIARSFMYAGVPALVVSLWQVNDVSTSIVMSKFYKYLSEGKSKTIALRQAKLQYIKNAKGIAAHPAFWSPFVLVGNEEPISISKKNNIFPWLIGGGVLLLLGLAGFMITKRS